MAEELAVVGEVDTMRTQHRDWYVAYAEHAEPKLTARGQHGWDRPLSDELVNLRAARAWSGCDPNSGDHQPAAGSSARPLCSGCECLGARPAPGWPKPSRTGRPNRARRERAGWHSADSSSMSTASWPSGRACLVDAVAAARGCGDASVQCLTLRVLALFSSESADARPLSEEAVPVHAPWVTNVSWPSR